MVGNGVGVGVGVGAGAGVGDKFHFSISQSNFHFGSLSLSHLNYTLGLLDERGGLPDWIRSEVRQPFRVIGNTSRIFLSCVLGLANCQLGTAEEPLLLLLLLRFTGRDATISPNGRLTWTERSRGRERGSCTWRRWNLWIAKSTINGWRMIALAYCRAGYCSGSGSGSCHGLWPC